MTTTAATEFIVVLVTVPTREEGERLADALVGEQRAACINIVGPVRSIYRWEGEIQRDDEWLLVIKTRAVLFEGLAAQVKALHSYQTPEVIAVPITAGAPAYLDWLRSATVPSNERSDRT